MSHNIPKCPDCGAINPDGHADDCRVASYLYAVSLPGRMDALEARLTAVEQFAERIYQRTH